MSGRTTAAPPYLRVARFGRRRRRSPCPALAASWQRRRRHDLGVQAAAGRQIHERRGLHRARRDLLGLPHPDGRELARRTSRSPPRGIEGHGSAGPADAGHQDQRARIRCCRTTWRSSASSRPRCTGAAPNLAFKRGGCKGLGTPPKSVDFNDPAKAVGTGPYKLARVYPRHAARAGAQRRLLGRQAPLEDGHLPPDHRRRPARRGAARRRRRHDREPADPGFRAGSRRPGFHDRPGPVQPHHLPAPRPVRRTRPGRRRA